MKNKEAVNKDIFTLSDTRTRLLDCRIYLSLLCLILVAHRRIVKCHVHLSFTFVYPPGRFLDVYRVFRKYDLMSIAGHMIPMSMIQVIQVIIECDQLHRIRCDTRLTLSSELMRVSGMIATRSPYLFTVQLFIIGL